jgi:hypothetical protein
MRDLLTLVERDFPRFAPLVRARWDALETGFERDAVGVEAEAAAARRAGRTTEASALLTACMARSAAAYTATLETLLAELRAVS